MFFIATEPAGAPGHWLVSHYYEKAGVPKTWWHVPEAGHGEVPALRREAYAVRIVRFFDNARLLDGR